MFLSTKSITQIHKVQQTMIYHKVVLHPGFKKYLPINIAQFAYLFFEFYINGNLQYTFLGQASFYSTLISKIHLCCRVLQFSKFQSKNNPLCEYTRFICKTSVKSLPIHQSPTLSGLCYAYFVPSVMKKGHILWQ